MSNCSGQLMTIMTICFFLWEIKILHLSTSSLIVSHGLLKTFNLPHNNQLFHSHKAQFKGLKILPKLKNWISLKAQELLKQNYWLIVSFFAKEMPIIWLVKKGRILTLQFFMYHALNQTNRHIVFVSFNICNMSCVVMLPFVFLFFSVYFYVPCFSIHISCIL